MRDEKPCAYFCRLDIRECRNMPIASVSGLEEQSHSKN